MPDQRQDGVTEPGLPISIVNVDGGEKDDEKDDGEKDDEKDDGKKDDEKDDGEKDDGKDDEKDDGDKVGENDDGESSTVVAGSSAILLATLFSI